MPEHLAGLQVAPTTPQQGQQQQQTQQEIQKLRRRSNTPSSLGEFIVDDLKLFASPVKVVVDEFLRQLKR